MKYGGDDRREGNDWGGGTLAADCLPQCSNGFVPAGAMSEWVSFGREDGRDNSAVNCK
jgi:hypothetical protein